jgi:hypothetical protein
MAAVYNIIRHEDCRLHVQNTTSRWSFDQLSITRVDRWLADPIYEVYSTHHVAKIDTYHHLIGTSGTSYHASSADWSLPFFMPVFGIVTWHACGIFSSKGPRRLSFLSDSPGDFEQKYAPKRTKRRGGLGGQNIFPELVWPTWVAGALFRGARCIHINCVCFHTTSPSLRSRDFLVKGRNPQTPRCSMLTNSSRC